MMRFVMSNSTSSSPTGNFVDAGNGVGLPPFRSLDDFLLNNNRFGMPAFNDLPKWNNRIIANLVYYQTNYFAFFFIVVLLQSFFQAQNIVLGASAIAAVGAVMFFSISSNPTFYQARRDHPIVTLGAIVLTVYYFITMLGAVAAVTFCILFPVLLILIHASIRLRDFMNKMAQGAEKMGLQTTVMGRLLDVCGMTVKA